MDPGEVTAAVAQVVGFAAFPVLVLLGILAAIALTVRGQWQEGVSTGLEFWVAGGVLQLSILTTWTAIAATIIIIAVRRTVMWSLDRAQAARAHTPPASSR